MMGNMEMGIEFSRAGTNNVNDQRNTQPRARGRSITLEDSSLPVLVLKEITPLSGSSHHVLAGDRLRAIIDSSSYEQIVASNRARDTALHVAARFGCFDLVQVIVQRMKRTWSIGDLHWMLRLKNKDGNTPLHEAVLSRNQAVVRYLLGEHPEPLFWQNKQGKSALYLAVEKEDLNILDCLLDISLDPEEYASKVQGKSPVHAAVTYKQIGMLEAMAEKKRPLFDVESMSDYTALHLAAFLSDLPAVVFLLRVFPSFALRYDERGYLPIHVACMVAHIRVIKVLINSCGNPLDFLNEDNSCGNPLDFLNEEGQNILHIAAKYGRSMVVTSLLKDPRLETLINHRDDKGNTALHLAAAYWQPMTVVTLTGDDRVDLMLTNDKCQTAYDVVCEQDPRIKFSSWRQWLSYVLLTRAGARGSRDLFLRPYDIWEVYPRRKFAKDPTMDQLMDRVGSQLIVATLIATVAFAAGFTVPGGFDSSDSPNKGVAVLINSSMFRAFVICDAIAMYSAILVVLLLLGKQAIDDPYAIWMINWLSIVPLYTALLAMSGAFMTGIYPILGENPGLRNAVLAFGIISCALICETFLVRYTPRGCRNRLIRRIGHYEALLVTFLSGSMNWRSPIIVKEEEERHRLMPSQVGNYYARDNHVIFRTARP